MKNYLAVAVLMLAGFGAAIPTNPTPPPPPGVPDERCQPGREWECCQRYGDCPPHPPPPPPPPPPANGTENPWWERPGHSRRDGNGKSRK